MEFWIGVIVVLGIVAWAIWALGDNKRSAGKRPRGLGRRCRCRG